MDVTIISKNEALKRLDKMVSSKDVCYYLSEDYSSLARIRKSVGYPYDIKILGDRFHAAIVEIGKSYLQFCHKVGLKNHSPIYWESHLASRNSASIPLLRNLVYFYCARQLLKNDWSQVIFICDSVALAGVICREVKGRGGRCRLEMGSKLFSFLQTSLGFLKRSMVFLAYYFARWFYVRRLENPRINNEDKARYVLRSWVTVGCFDNMGNYRDRNFGVLSEYLRNNGKDVWTIPLFFNLGKKFFSYIKLMERCHQKFIFPEQYLTIFDAFRILRDGIRGLFIDLSECEFLGSNVSTILREAHLKTSLSPNLLMYNSDKYLLQRISKRGVKVDCFIYPIENNVVEKPFILAAQRHYPDAKITGFQHTMWFKEQLGMFLNPEELGYHPLPDQIICSGQRYLDVLSKAGFPGDKLYWGPNLRYTMVNHFHGPRNFSPADNNKGILVILNFNMNHAMEMLEKLGVALRRVGGSRVCIKPHPLLSIKRLSLFLQDIGFPKHEWVEGSVQEWVAKAEVVVMTGGSVSNLETMAMGVPLLRISLENDFDLDPLWDEYPFAPFVSATEEISGGLIAAFNLSDAKRDELIKFGNKVIENYFEPVTEERMRVFL